jgi:hypothetical protein
MKMPHVVVRSARRARRNRSIVQALEPRTLMSAVLYDAAAGFSATKNPNGPWSYGSSASEFSAMTVYSTPTTGVPNLPSWHGTSSTPEVFKNTSSSTIVNSTVKIAAGQLGAHPGSNGQYSHVRFTAPAAGTYAVTAKWTGIDVGGSFSPAGTTTDVHLLYNGKSFFDGAISGFGKSASKSITFTNVAKGATIEFLVGYGSNKTYFDDSTAISAQITENTSATGTLSGSVFHDLNGNGSQSSGEPNLSGWTVFLDANKNGHLDAGEKNTITSASGAYTFTSLTPGSYRVAEVVKSGWVAVAPTGGFADVTLAAGATTSKSFADARPASIAGVIFKDLNADGFQEPTEGGLAGRKVYLDLNNNGKLDASDLTTTTNSSGAFSFAGLKPGTYVIRVVPTNGSTATTLTAQTVTLLSGWTITGVDFGYSS